jgi:hypothetical protein
MNLKEIGGMKGVGVVRGLASLAGWDTEEEVSIVEEILLKPMSEARGLAFEGL